MVTVHLNRRTRRFARLGYGPFLRAGSASVANHTVTPRVG